MATAKQLKLTVDPERRDWMVKHLGYIRCWIQGFEAAGKSGPHVSDTLRQVQLLLGEAK